MARTKAYLARASKKALFRRSDDHAYCEADAPPITSPEVPRASAEAEAGALAEGRVQPEAMNVETEVPPTQPAVSAATRLVASPYRSTLPRRPLPT